MLGRRRPPFCPWRPRLDDQHMRRRGQLSIRRRPHGGVLHARARAGGEERQTRELN